MAMKEYEYSQSLAKLAVGLGVALLALMASFFGWFEAGLLFYGVFGGVTAYLIMAIIRYSPRKIELYEDELVVPSLTGFFVRRIKYKNIKAVSLYHRNNDSFIRLRLKKGLKCTIFGSFVNRKGPRSMGIKPYEDLLKEIECRVEL